MADLNRLSELVERLRKEAIGEPTWNEEKQVFEYSEHSEKVVVVLKIIRAVQGLHALDVLCSVGLFVDFGVIVRCVYDCVYEVHFLLENFPEASGNTTQFVEIFFSSTIDGDLSHDTTAVPTKKIRNAMVRTLKGCDDEQMRAVIDRIYKTFCGYVHANYVHVMEMYNGGTKSFNLSGVPSQQQRRMRMAHVEEATKIVANTTAITAAAFGLNDLYREILES
jgi:hypothetical protein